MAVALTQPPTPLFRPEIAEPDALLSGVPELVLQDVWKHRRFDVRAARLCTGERLDVLHAGRHNTDAGPDFLDARVALTDPEGRTVVLAGDVEVHRTSSEWVLHRHNEDSRYDRVVLHVAFAEDRHTGKLRRADSTLLPEVVLGQHVGGSLRRLLFDFFANPRPHFPCAGTWETVPDGVRRRWVGRLGRERFAERVAGLAEWGEPAGALLHAVFRALGYAPNAEPMVELSRRAAPTLSSELDLLDREALLFGLSGLLPAPESLRGVDPPAADHVAALAARFEAIGPAERPMAATWWSAARLRPTNQPALRIAQAAALTGRQYLGAPDVLAVTGEMVRDREPIRALRRWLLSAEPSTFWMDHVRFQTRVPPGTGHLGTDRADRLIVDAILPAVALLARRTRDRPMQKRVLEVAAALPAPSDSLTRRYAPFKPSGELEASGLRTLARDWCARGRCLECAVGKYLVGDRTG